MNELTAEQKIRLEVMKIAHRPDKDIETNVERMKALVEFVEGNAPVVKTTRKDRQG